VFTARYELNLYIYIYIIQVNLSFERFNWRLDTHTEGGT
jgi:hypothetical protein